MNGDGTTDFTFAYDFHFIGVRPEGDGKILTWLDPPPNVGGSVAPVPAGLVVSPTADGQRYFRIVRVR